MESREDNLDGLVKLSFFANIGKAITAETSIRGVLNRVMEHIALYFAPLNWSLLLLDSDADELIFKVAVGQFGHKLEGVRIPADEGVAGWIVKHGTPVILGDVATDPRFSDRTDRMTGFTTESIIAVPLRTRRGTFGVIELINKPDHTCFTPFDLNVLSTIGDFAAIAIEKAYYLQAARRLAMTDPPTGALNRRGLARAVERERGRVRRYGGELAVLVADLDGFKSINDKRGHAAGDEVLRTVGKALRRGIREIDSVARIGGDEFLILMPTTDRPSAERARIRIAALLKEASATCPAGEFSVTIGLHVSADADFEAILRKSDADLYRRKEGAVSIEHHLIEAIEDEQNRAPGTDQEDDD